MNTDPSIKSQYSKTVELLKAYKLHWGLQDSTLHVALSLIAIWGEIELLSYGLAHRKIGIAQSRVIFFCIYFKRLDRIQFLNFYLSKINATETFRDEIDNEKNRPYYNITIDIENNDYDYNSISQFSVLNRHTDL